MAYFQYFENRKIYIVREHAYFYFFENKMFIENILGSRAKVKIVRVLAESRAAFSMNNIKNETGLSLGIVHKAVEDLTGEDILVKIRGTGKGRLFKFNSDSPFAAPLFDIFRIEKTRQRREVVLLHTWNALEKIVSKLKEKASLIALFGSQARGDATLRSDVDLLIIPKDSHDLVADALEETKSRVDINPVIISVDAFKSDIKRNTLFYRNIKSDSIILHIDTGMKKHLAKFLEDIQYKGA